MLVGIVSKNIQNHKYGCNPLLPGISWDNGFIGNVGGRETRKCNEILGNECLEAFLYILCVLCCPEWCKSACGIIFHGNLFFPGLTEAGKQARKLQSPWLLSVKQQEHIFFLLELFWLWIISSVLVLYDIALLSILCVVLLLHINMRNRNTNILVRLTKFRWKCAPLFLLVRASTALTLNTHQGSSTHWSNRVKKALLTTTICTISEGTSWQLTFSYRYLNHIDVLIWKEWCRGLALTQDQGWWLLKWRRV